MTEIEIVEQQSPLLGRQMVHDERSRAFPLRLSVDRSTWRDKKVRLFDPIPNPNQQVGCCTGVAKAMQFNALGNRKPRTLMGMAAALGIYSAATSLDPFEGTYPPEDTGSSGLASAKAAQNLGYGLEYRWIFGGADEVVQAVMAGEVISVGTWWYDSMFNLDHGKIGHGGQRVGGHQYVIRGYDKSKDWVLGRCWWGSFRDFWMPRTQLQDLLMDGGDAHWQRVNR